MQLYNTLTRQKEEFVPLDAGEVKIYSCGPTVYNYFHIGNARPFIIFDTLRRYMEYRGYSVNFVQNFTDIDDKMIKRANEEGISVKELAERFIAEYYVDAKGLGVREATHHPRATDNIEAIIAIISTLIEKGHAYQSGDDVYFDTRSFEPYGKLSNQQMDELEAGARVEIADIKRDPMDFALWKGKKPGEPAWESPWGEGRPGWHIECSAMANRYLGKTIDIHCGGQDLAFPHHENEIAQSEAANGCTFARFWLHNGYINVDNVKMSKSLNNFFTVRDAAGVYGYEPIRFFMLSAHYRSPINYSAESLTQAKAALERIYTCRDNLDFLLAARTETKEKAGAEFAQKLEGYRQSFISAMDNDLNTADAIAVIFDLVKEANTLAAAEGAGISDLKGARDMLSELSNVLGIAQAEKENTLDSEIEALIEKRQAARAARDFKTSDEIRDTLKARGIVLEDTPAGVKWRKE